MRSEHVLHACRLVPSPALLCALTVSTASTFGVRSAHAADPPSVVGPTPAPAEPMGPTQAPPATVPSSPIVVVPVPPAPPLVVVPAAPPTPPMSDATDPEEENRQKSIRLGQAPYLTSPDAVVAGQPTIGNFMDTRLTWTFGDDDVLHATGQVQPLSPTANIGDRTQYKLFFDSLNSQFAGRENLTHLVMYKKMPGFIEGLDTEAAMVIRFDATALAANNNNVNQALYDAGSYLRIFYRTGRKGTNEGLSFVFFPLDTDRFRLGYLYDISWGGTNANQNQSIFPHLNGSSPGMKVQYDGPRGLYVFGGFKTAQIPEIDRTYQETAADTNNVEQNVVAETNYGFLAGAGIDAAPMIHIDANGGYFQQGRFQQSDLLPPPNVDQSPPRVFTYGGSARIVLHHGMPAPQSVDFLLYRNDPNAPMLMFRPESYHAGEVTYAIALEGTQLEQNLHNGGTNSEGQTLSGATTIQAAHAAALYGQIKAGYTRLGLFAIYRDLPYVLRNQPGNPPFEAFTSADKLQGEEFFAGTLDYYIESLHLRPGIGGGLQLPAAQTAGFTVGNSPINRTTVYRSQGNISILPEGAGRSAILQSRLSLRWDISPYMAAVGWLQLIHDPNTNRLERDPTTQAVVIRTFQAPDFFGFGLSLQARY